MKLSRENIQSIATSGMGFNSAQLTILGVKNARKGWLSKLMGTEISESDWRLLCELKGTKPKEQTRIFPGREKVWRETTLAAREAARKSIQPELPISSAAEDARTPLACALESQFRHMMDSVNAGELFSASDHAMGMLWLVEDARI